MIELRRRTAPIWAICLVALLVLVTFSPLVRCGFTDWDDQDTIWANPHLHPATLSSIGYYWTHAENELYIPLTYTVWGGLTHLGHKVEGNGTIGPNPMVFHAANVVVHMLTSILALLILRRLIENDRAACIGALLFALHPLQTEAVAWASGMKDLLCGFFVLLALWQYLAWLQESEDAPPLRRRVRYAIAILAVILGTLCKPTTVIAPILAFVLDVALVRHSPKAAIKSLWPWVIAVIPCMIWTRLAQPPSLGAAVPILLRPVLALDALTFYLWKIIWPTSLAIDYGRNPAFEEIQTSLWLTWTIPVAIAVALWATRKKNGPFPGAAMLAAAGVLPVLGFIAFEYQTRSTVADHYVYISMLGVALAGAWLVTKLPNRVAFYAPSIALAVFALRSMDQTRYWHDSRALFAHTIEVNPRSQDAQQNLAVIIGFDAETAEAKSELYAQQKDPENAKAQHEEALAKLAESEFHLEKALEIQPGCAYALHTRAALRACFGKHEEAIAALQALIKELPNLREDEHELFKHDYDLLGRELLVVKRPAEAQSVFDQMLKSDPSDRAALRGKQRALAMTARSATQPAAALPISPILH